VSVEQPHKVVFEANTEANPELPRGGNWWVNHVHFDGDGEYLVVGYSFGGRLTNKSSEPVEIYETHTWKLIWSINSQEICSANLPRISPDRKKWHL